MDFAYIERVLPLYERAAVLTVQLGIEGILLSIVIGLVCALILYENSVFSAISLMDLMFTAKDLIGLYYKTTESLTLLVVFYLLILLPVSILGAVVERRVRYAGFGA